LQEFLSSVNLELLLDLELQQNKMLKIFMLCRIAPTQKRVDPSGWHANNTFRQTEAGNSI
jgi:hypothetical protein